MLLVSHLVKSDLLVITFFFFSDGGQNLYKDFLLYKFIGLQGISNPFHVLFKSQLLLYFYGSCSYLLSVGSQNESTKSSYTMHPTLFRHFHWVYVMTFKMNYNAYYFWSICFSFCILQSNFRPSLEMLDN